VTICVLPLSIAIVLVFFSVFIFSPIFLSYFSFSPCCCLAVSTSAVDCMIRLVFETTYHLSRGRLNPIHSLAAITASRLIHYCCTTADQCPVCSVKFITCFRCWSTFFNASRYHLYSSPQGSTDPANDADIPSKQTTIWRTLLSKFRRFAQSACIRKESST